MRSWCLLSPGAASWGPPPPRPRKQPEALELTDLLPICPLLRTPVAVPIPQVKEGKVKELK